MESADLVMRAIRAVEDRDGPALLACYDPEVTFEWPPGLPYSGTWSGPGIETMSGRFRTFWDALQPTEADRQMSARVVAADADAVVVAYVVRARNQRDRVFETETLASYRVRNGRLLSASMFYRDHAGLLAFCEEAAALGAEGGES